MREHILQKLWPPIGMRSGREEGGEKCFEVRRDDRGFQKGDILVLKRVWESGYVSGPDLRREITYVDSPEAQDNSGSKVWICRHGPDSSPPPPPSERSDHNPEWLRRAADYLERKRGAGHA